MKKPIAIELSQRFFFEAAHTLRRSIDTEGSLRVHGHTYEAEVTLRGQVDKESGMLVDLGYFRKTVSIVREMLDHRLLDDVQGLGPATLENLCLFIGEQVGKDFPHLCCVAVWRRASGDKCFVRWE